MMQDTHIALAHGNGGRFMRELIDEVFARHLANPVLDVRADAVPIDVPPGDGQLMFTTDGFTVQPIEFPGGDIGMLAVHGTTNDLAVSGATPLYLSLNDSPPTRYAKLHVKFSRLIPVIDALVDIGLLEQKKGYFDRVTGVRRRTRIFPTKDMTALFQEYDLDEPGIITKVRPEDIIYLRDTKKNEKRMLEIPDTRTGFERPMSVPSPI